MNEWKELHKDNLPPDILVEDYEWEWYKPESGGWCSCGWDVALIFLNLWRGSIPRKFRYRLKEPEPKQPTHEELAEEYLQNLKLGKINIASILDLIKKAFIKGRESADIPSEYN